MSHVSHVPSVPGVLFVPLREVSHGTPLRTVPWDTPDAGHLAWKIAPTSRPSRRRHEHWREDGTPARSATALIYNSADFLEWIA